MADNDNSPPRPPASYDTCAAAYGLPLPAALGPSPDIAIGTVAAYLRAAAIGTSPVANAVTALRTFMAALPRGDLRTTSPDVLTNLRDALEPVLHRLTLAELPGMTRDGLMLGFSAVGYFIGLFLNPSSVPPGQVAYGDIAERLDHLALLANELDATERRRRIALHGNQMARRLTIHDAAGRSDTAGLPLH